ncbi:DUF4876 domain-containing protein [Tannerella sp.]|uniref:DUF4876 domain-containing protein n=1 Tax=Tannerella sp. TaxID=2382127 RepID=UPI0026DC1E16|nr:DUF4876 domain-containing protein [Tannerella sp.]MDO4704543.1 DUF4876 domain-containing protein [Tannerella sp.]
MKKILYLMISTLILFTSCNDDEKDYQTFGVKIQLAYPQGSPFTPTEGVEVTLTDSKGSSLKEKTDKTGIASFKVPAGVYKASATDTRQSGGHSYIYSGTKGDIAISMTTSANLFVLDLTESKKGQVVIKELYISGCPKNDGSGNFFFDRYVILYNNSAQPASLDNLCLGMVFPFNSFSPNEDYKGGKLFYESEGWVPASNGIWYFPKNVTIEPGKQILIALNGAIDHTKTYTKSVDLSKPEYYCTYDVSVYDNTSFYPAPSAAIPSSHYLSAVKYGMGNAWPLSNTSPAFFIFTTKDVTPAAFANDKSNFNYYQDKINPVFARLKIKDEWVLDGIEVFMTGKKNNQKRLTAKVDAGQVHHQDGKGYTLYRNVDLEATKAVPGNEAKLVYKYDKGTEIDGKASTDPSGIDAEASLKKGARIIYMDSNNSTNDFHQRRQSSLKD